MWLVIGSFPRCGSSWFRDRGTYAPQILALCLVGPAALPLLIAADLIARWFTMRRHQPLGYLFNFSQVATSGVVTLALIQVTTGGDLQTLGRFPSGTVAAFVLLLGSHS